MNIQELYLNIGGDYQDARGRLMNDRIISKFIVKFLDDPSYNSLLAAWESKNEKDIFVAAHTMKGVCANLALTDIRNTVEEITEIYRPVVKEQPISEDITELMNVLDTQYKLAISMIQQFRSENC